MDDGTRLLEASTRWWDATRDDPARLVAVLHYDGTPITARFITQAITKQVHALAVSPKKQRA